MIRPPFWLTFVPLLLLMVLAGCKPSGKPPAPTESKTAAPTNPVKTAAEQIEEKLRAIRQAGDPVTIEEWTNWHTANPPDSQNGAIYWTNALAALIPIPTNAPELPPRNKPLSAASRDYFQRFLASNSVAFERMRAAQTFEHARYRRYLSSNPAQYRLASQLNKAARLIRVEAILYSDNRNPGPAVAAVETLAALARSLQETPDFECGSQMEYLWGMVSDAIERVIGENELDRGQLSKLQAIFHSSLLSEALARCLVAERCVNIHCYQHWREEILPVLEETEQSDHGHYREPFPADEIPALAAKFDQQREADFLFYLDTMNEVIAASRLPYPQSILAVRSATFKIEEQYILPRDQQFAWSLRSLPFFESIAASTAARVAALNTAECAVAVERYRLDHHGLLPINLENLLPAYLSEVPKDPFDGKPLRFKWLPKGYVVYSIGKDCRDNGGKEPPGLDGGVIGSDITFTVER